MARAVRSFKSKIDPRQLALPLVAAPLQVRAHGLQAMHAYPHVMRIRDKGRRAGERWSGRVPASHAWAYQWINLQDAGSTWATLTYDCDNAKAMQDGLADLPPWNWRIETERGAHVTWCLADPVGRLQAHRPAPQRMLARLSEYFHHALDADPAFSGLGRNPTHPDAAATWGAERPHYMADLCNVIPFNWRRPRLAATAMGRQVTLWETALAWAGSECNAGKSVLWMLRAINADVGELHGREPLPDRDLVDIAQRVERYRAQWMVRGWHKPAFIERQRRRGAAGGKAKAGKPVKGKVQASATAGMTDTELAATLGVSRRTLVYWKANGKLAAKIAHLANTVNAPGLPKNCAQKTGENVGGRAATQKNVDKYAASQQDGIAADLPFDPTDHRDPATQRFWQDRAARIAAEV